jgi:2'-5' RNA ligase
MRAWLARHETDKTGEGFSPGEKGFPSPGRVAWALWAGDPAVTWSERKVAALDREKKRKRDALALPAPPEHRQDADGVGVWVGVPLPSSALLAWEAARQGAAWVTGEEVDDLDLRGHEPHVTLLWAGRVDPADLERTQQAVVAALDEVLVATGTDATHRAATHAPLALRGAGLGAFAPSEGSDGDTPLFLAIEDEALCALHEALSERLLTTEERQERPAYRPHATVGYLGRELTDDEWATLPQVPTHPGPWDATEVHLSIGGEVVARWILGQHTQRPRSTGHIGLTEAAGPDGHHHLLHPGAPESGPGADGHTHPYTPGATQTGPGGANAHTHTVALPPLPRG